MGDVASGGRRFRCAVAAADEPLAGTAAHDVSFLLIEHPGPWGAKALAESDLPAHVRAGVAQAASVAGVRVQLIRRHGRSGTGAGSGIRVFLAHADPAAAGGAWVETTVLEEAEDLLDLDLDGLAEGRRPGLETHVAPLFLVCTNGRRDACCAEFGRPVAAVLAEAFPEQTWETTHLGGHRFAAALLTLPDAMSYGRLDAAAALSLAAKSLEGRVDLPHLRGRSAHPPVVQAAEIAALQWLDTDVADALSLLEVVPVGRAGRDGRDDDAGHTGETDEDAWRVAFTHAGGSIRVGVHAHAGPGVRASCGDEAVKPTVRFVTTVLR